MTTRITPSGPATGVQSTVTAARVTPAPARPFKQVMSASERAIVGGAEAAVTHLPGGPVLAAAFRPGAGSSAAGSGVDGGVRTLGSITSRAEGPTGTATDPSAGGSSAPNMDQVLSQSADQTLYYLQLQERISAENRAYTAVSNVLKARHDTVKNAIANIR